MRAESSPRRARRRRALLPTVIVAVLAATPLLPVRLPLVFDGALNSPGVLYVLALCLVFGTVALTYDLLFGFTGLLSFGHALYFAIGVYVTAIAVTRFGLSLAAALPITAAAGLAVPLVLGSISLRVRGIAFAMVTLAFAQAGNVFVHRDPLRITGGEEGLSLAYQRLPPFLVGVFNVKYVYWIALLLAVAAYAAGWWAVRSRPGRVWQAIRENERRVEVLGMRPYGFKLLAFVTSSFLATMAGAVYVLLVQGAHPEITGATFTLTLLVMVVLGGTGTLWGAVAGGVLYTYLDHRLGAFSGSEAIGRLPEVVAVPLSEPLFVLGALFVLLVMFFPGGLAGLARRKGRLEAGGDLAGSARRALAPAPASGPGGQTPSPAGTPAAGKRSAPPEGRG